MNTAITTVVPHPGATFPYSELSGRNAVPKAVTFPVPASLVSCNYTFANCINSK